MTAALEIHGLIKAFGRVRAVDGLDLTVARGEIYGFLGLNGAGKTTTIRTLLGLIRPTAGQVRVLGEPVGPNGRGPWARVGHLVETPAAYPELTVRENLEIARRLQGVRAEEATHRVIAQLGLAPYADRRAGTLSLGNYQRLGLARALLHAPELLILDEPANGLDPAGVVEVRELLQGLARERGVTVFMSSHILSEVDRLATRIGIIHRGRLIQEFEAGALEALRTRRLEVQTLDLTAARAALAQAGYAAETEADRLCLTDEAALAHPEAVATLLVRAGTPPTQLAVTHEDLEAYFLRLTGGGA
jgi:ABC-2 type transport system ATP-binding protein